MLQNLPKFYTGHPTKMALLAKKIDSSQPAPHFSIQGLIFFKGRLFIPAEFDFRTILMAEFHSSIGGGHSSVNDTFVHLTAIFS